MLAADLTVAAARVPSGITTVQAVGIFVGIPILLMPDQLYVLVLACIVVGLTLYRTISHSRFGRGLLAVKPPGKGSGFDTARQAAPAPAVLLSE